MLIFLILIAKPLLSQDEIICFVYHRFGDNRYPSTNIQTELFHKHLQYIKSKGFRVLTLSEAITGLKKNTLQGKTAVITIDDGYKSFKTGAVPILEEYGYPATLFINTNTIGGHDYLSWKDIREIRDKGIEIGNHSHSHAYFLNMKKKERKQKFRDDLRQSQKILKEQTGTAPVVYSYPYGEYDETMQKVLEEEGFLCAAAQNSGVISKYSNLYSLPRFPMNEKYAGLEGFITKASMHALPVTGIISGHTVFENNPPMLKLKIEKEKIIPDQIQCFIDGSRSCIKETTISGKALILGIKSKGVLNNRRTLYTITAPRTGDKGWCWFSHVWVNPEVEE